MNTLHRWAIALDRWINRLLGLIPALRRYGFGEHETVSSRVGKLADQGHEGAHIFCAILDWFDPAHCKDSQEPV